jgi:hypothetical protein
MLVFLIDIIFAMFGGRVFQQTVGIPMDTNCASLLADLFLYLYEADFFFFWNKVHVSLIITDISNVAVEDLLRTMFNYKRGYLNFQIVKFPTPHAYGEYIF